MEQYWINAVDATEEELLGESVAGDVIHNCGTVSCSSGVALAILGSLVFGFFVSEAGQQFWPTFVSQMSSGLTQCDAALDA